MTATDTEGASTPSLPRTFLFADVVGFTALTEAHGDLACAELAESFTSAVRNLVRVSDAEVVKTIGDEVMVQAKSADTALALGLTIVARLAIHGSPPVRVGMHTGTAIERRSDWFGAAVNLASRVSGAARPGEVLITDATRAELNSDSVTTLEARGQRTFRHVRAPVAIYSAGRFGGSREGLEIDPVCRMAVDPARADSSQVYRGETHHFCSKDCSKTFANDPGYFAEPHPR